MNRLPKTNYHSHSAIAHGNTSQTHAARLAHRLQETRTHHPDQ